MSVMLQPEQDMNAVIEQMVRQVRVQNDFLLAAQAFVEDGGDPWEIQAGETAWLGQPLTLAELMEDLGIQP